MNSQQKENLVKANIRINCSTSNLSFIRVFVKEKLLKYVSNMRLLDNLVLAVDEAVANAIIHGHGNEEKNTILLEVELDEKALNFKISDIGEIDFKQYTFLKRDVKELARKKIKGGVGLKIIYKVMDIVEYKKIDGVNYCLLKKYVTNSEYQKE